MQHPLFHAEKQCRQLREHVHSQPGRLHRAVCAVERQQPRILKRVGADLQRRVLAE